MMLWQKKAGAHYIYYVLSLAWLLELIHPPPPSLSLSLSLIVLARNFLSVTCQDASRIDSSVDRNLPEGLRGNAASHCHALFKLIFSRFIVPE